MTAESTETQGMRRSAFTLIELLIVILIISALFTISFVGFKGVREASKKKEAATEIGLFALKLNDFRLDYGFLPQSKFVTGTPPQSVREPGIYTPDPTDEAYKQSSRVLFLALTGRTRYDDFESEGRVYYNPKEKNIGSPNEGPPGDEIYPDESETYKEQSFTSGSYFKDPWGNPYGFYYDPEDPKWKSYHSPSSFDIWSTSGELEGETKNRLKWVTSWDK